jgi:hypothetical protein
MAVAFIDIKFILRLIVAMRMGFIVGIKEEYEWIEEQFKVVDGEVYYKGYRLPYVPKNDDGWSVEPVFEPLKLFEMIIHDALLDNIYVVMKDGTQLTLWSLEKGWKSMNILVPSPQQSSGIMSLKEFAGITARDHIGPLLLKEYEYIMDYHTRKEVFKPLAWWVPM